MTIERSPTGAGAGLRAMGSVPPRSQPITVFSRRAAQPKAVGPASREDTELNEPAEAEIRAIMLGAVSTPRRRLNDTCFVTFSAGVVQRGGCSACNAGARRWGGAVRCHVGHLQNIIWMDLHAPVRARACDSRARRTQT